MNAVLVAGCTLGGAAAGAILDFIAAHIPARAPDDPMPGHVSAASAPTVRPQPPGVRGAIELVGAPLLTAALFGAAAARLGAVPVLGAYCAFFAGLVAMSVVDLRVGLVPRRLLYPILAVTSVGLLGASWAQSDWGALGHAAIGGAIAQSVFFAIWWVYPKGLGFGDVRLAGLIGLGLGWLGLRQLYVGFSAAFFLGALFGVLATAVRGRKARFPFAPALSLGAVIGVLWGGAIVNAWLGHGS